MAPPYIVLHRGDLLEVILRHRRKQPTLILEAAKDVTAVADGLDSTVRPLVVADELHPTGYVAYRGAVPVQKVDRRVGWTRSSPGIPSHPAQRPLPPATERCLRCARI